MTSAQIKQGFVRVVMFFGAVAALTDNDSTTRMVAALLVLGLYLGGKLERIAQRQDQSSPPAE